MGFFVCVRGGADKTAWFGIFFYSAASVHDANGTSNISGAALCSVGRSLCVVRGMVTSQVIKKIC